MDIIITYGQSNGVLYFGINLLVMDSIITQIIKQESHYQTWKVHHASISTHHNHIETIKLQGNNLCLCCSMSTDQELKIILLIIISRKLIKIHKKK